MIGKDTDTEKGTLLSRLHNWAEVLVYDCEPGAAPLVEDIVCRLQRQARELGATELEIAEAGRVEVAA